MSEYAIITPAHNEEDSIEMTLDSVTRQTRKPVRWIIVDDASTDRTGAIVQDWANRHAFIQLLSIQRESGRNFARKALAFGRGYAEVRGLDFEFVGNLDADMSFGSHYFENILAEFDSDPKLGVSGGIVYTRFARKFATHDHTLDSVGGKVQLFRRKCFEEIGGYRPFRYGGIDAAAEISARMRGWKVRKSLENPAYEHRRTGFADGTALKSSLRDGRKFHSLGYDPLFYAFRCLFRLADYPMLLGSGVSLVSFFCSMLRRDPILLETETVDYLRREQRAKLTRALRFWSKE